MKKEVEKKVSMEDLAGMVARGFDSVDKRFDKLENEFELAKKENAENFKKIRNDILDIGDKFVPRHEFDTLLIRVGRLEQRVSEKIGK